MQVFIVGSIYDTVMVLDKKRRHKQWVELQQIIDAIDGKKAWKNHPCTIQYREHKNWLLLYRTVIEYINMDMHEKTMNKIKNLHLESFYLQGARDLLLRLQEMNAIPQFIGKKDCTKDFQVYNKATFDEIIYNRESLVKFLQGAGWRYYDHQRDKKGKLVSVKVEFN